MLGAFVRKHLGRRSAEIGDGVSHFLVDRGHIMLRRPGGAFALLAAATTSTATATPTTAACIAVAFATSVARLGFPASFDGLAVSLSLLIGFGETLAFRKLALLLALSLTLLAALALGLPLPAFPGSITALARLAAPATAATPAATTTIVTALAACLRRLFFSVHLHLRRAPRLRPRKPRPLLPRRFPLRVLRLLPSPRLRPHVR